MRKLLPLFLGLAAVCACGPAGTMPADSRTEEEVNVGYGTVSRKELGFSVDKVKVNENVVSSYTSIAEYLRSRVAGLEINPNGTIQIRGKNTILGPSEALILVDNMPCSNINDINPMDVQSVEVLKDGSASIYGMQGANGVVLITTKGAVEKKKAEAEARKAEQEALKAARKAEKEARKAARKQNN